MLKQQQTANSTEVRVRSSNKKSQAPPPPLPPKPLNTILMNMNQQQTTSGSYDDGESQQQQQQQQLNNSTENKSKELRFRKYFSYGDKYQPVEIEKINSYTGVSNTSEKHDAYNQSRQLDSDKFDDENESRSNYLSAISKTSSGILTNREATKTTKYSQISINTTQPSTKINLSYSNNIQAVNVDPSSLHADNMYLNNNEIEQRKIKIDTRIQTHITKPIVTESTEEADNANKALTRRNRSANINTVEILEVPSVLAKSPPTTTSFIEHLSDKGKTRCNYSKNNPTFSRSSLLNERQLQLFYENNNSYAIPVVTSVSDDEEEYDDDPHNENDVELLNELEVETILNESCNSFPPKTSTPSKSDNHTKASTGPPPDNANSSTTFSKLKDDKLSQYKRNLAISLSDSDQDVLNTSKETDEITNTSAGGGELIGINDQSSEQVNNTSKDSALTRTKVSDTSSPFFNNSKMHSSSHHSEISPNTHSNLNQTDQYRNESEQKSSTYPNDECQNRIDELERLSSSLISEVKSLKSQVLSLNSKLSELELQVDKQQQQLVDNNSSRQYLDQEFDHINRSNLNISSSSMRDKFPPLNQDLSKSMSTINKLPSNQVSSSPTSTYSRNNVAHITSRPNETYSPLGTQSRSGYISSSSTLGISGGGRVPHSNSCNNTVTKSTTSKKFNVHSSTNSLYADSMKSVGAGCGSSSISPTLNYNKQHHHPYGQLNSPNASSMTLNLSRKDPISHASMLSLSSLGGQSTTSTLKRAALGNSVTNLSQATTNSQLVNWPSFGDFITAKQRDKDIVYDEEKKLVRMVLYNRIIDMKVPSWIGSNYSLDKVLEPPQVKLKLDWVYGYRGRDCRTNIFYLPTGECVYFIASIVVLYNVETKSQRHYLGHTDSVKCLAVHPNKLVIASGQSSVHHKRPIVRVWNTVSLQTLRVIGFNEDFDRSICCLAFSKADQGAILAVVDESNEHTITLLDWQREKSWRLAETNSGHEPVLAIDFHPMDTSTLVAVGKSTINFWDTRGMTMSKKAGFFDKFDKPKYVLCLAFNDIGETITGDSNGNIIIWPRGSNRPKRVIHDIHQGGVFSILAMKDGSYLSGGRDRRIVEWDSEFNQTGREAELPEHCGGVRFITYAKGSQVLIGTLRNSILMGSFETNFILIMQGHAEATSSLAIHPTQNQYLTGGFDNQLHFFETRTHEVLWSKCIMMPATSACFSPNGLILIVGSTQGKWIVIDVLTQEILFSATDGSGSLKCIKFSPDGKYFAMGSSDAHIYVYETTESGNKFCRIGTCVGHSAPIIEIDWSDEGRYMQTQSLNLELLFWKASNCQLLDSADILNDLKWSTHNCTLGFSVIGIWSDCIDSALINHCDKSNKDHLTVSVTDNGNINVFKWPPCYDQCLSQKYYGNVEKLDFIKFTPDDSRLIAIGAKNCVTTEWIVEKSLD